MSRRVSTTRRQVPELQFCAAKVKARRAFVRAKTGITADANFAHRAPIGTSYIAQLNFIRLRHGSCMASSKEICVPKLRGSQYFEWRCRPCSSVGIGRVNFLNIGDENLEAGKSVERYGRYFG